MYSEKIFIGKMKAYLKDIILKYNTSNFPDFLNYSKSLLKQNQYNDDILKIFYFEKFYPILKKNEVISFTKNNLLDKNYINEIDNEIINLSTNNKLNQNKFLYIQLKKFGNFRKSILNSIFQKYETTDNQTFLMLSKIFLINSYTSNSWEMKCLLRMEDIIKLDKIDTLTFKLLEHLNKKGGEKKIDLDKIINENRILSVGDEVDTTKTQKSLEIHLNQMKLNYKTEFNRDFYRYDYFLPEENCVIEYDGPDHFYPLQTQLNENSKFKYKNIKEKFSSRIVIVPHFEYSRYDSPELAFFFLKKLIFKNSDIFNTALFHENFNYFVPLHNIIE
jgi:hypothetical protein